MSLNLDYMVMGKPKALSNVGCQDIFAMGKMSKRKLDLRKLKWF